MNDGERKQQDGEKPADDGRELRDGERISEGEISEGDALDDTPPREDLPGG